MDTVFVPKYVVKQLLLAMALETGVITYRQLTVTLKALCSNFSSRSRLIAELERQQRVAKTQDDWMSLAEAIDQAQGNTVWRSDPECALYEKDRITARIDEFVHLMRRRDIFELMFILRGGITRNKFGLLHEGLVSLRNEEKNRVVCRLLKASQNTLIEITHRRKNDLTTSTCIANTAFSFFFVYKIFQFSRALAGTKVLVETYHNVVCAALDFVCDAPVSEGEQPIPTDARLAFFNETRHAYGRSALILSGGAARKLRTVCYDDCATNIMVPFLLLYCTTYILSSIHYQSSLQWVSTTLALSKH